MPAYLCILCFISLITPNQIILNMSAQPNILVILTDQQTQRAVSSYGNPYLHTPYMDTLVHGGVSFENSYCTAPVCSPSRSSLLTGLMPHQTGVEINGPSIKP